MLLSRVLFQVGIGFYLRDGYHVVEFWVVGCYFELRIVVGIGCIAVNFEFPTFHVKPVGAFTPQLDAPLETNLLTKFFLCIPWHECRVALLNKLSEVGDSFIQFVLLNLGLYFKKDRVLHTNIAKVLLHAIFACDELHLVVIFHLYFLVQRMSLNVLVYFGIGGGVHPELSSAVCGRY